MKPLTTIEKAYLRLGVGRSLLPSDLALNDGVSQFRKHQSEGVVPENPHTTYRTLCIGKTRRDTMVKEIREDYFGLLGTGHWTGLAGFVDDWNPDLWMIPILLPWHEKAQELKEVWVP